MAKHWKKLNEKSFLLVKTLRNAGVKTKDIISISGISSGTVSKITRSETLADYVTMNRTYLSNRQPKPEEEIVVAEEESIENLFNKLNEVPSDGNTHFSEDSRNIARIATALERLADAWEAQPSKKKFF